MYCSNTHKKSISITTTVIYIITMILSFSTVSFSSSQVTRTWEYAYSQFLSTQFFNVEFALYDMDMDGVPELLLCRSSNQGGYALYTYDGQMKLLHEWSGYNQFVWIPGDINMHGLFTQDGGNYAHVNYIELENNVIIETYVYSWHISDDRRIEDEILYEEANKNGPRNLKFLPNSNFNASGLLKQYRNKVIDSNAIEVINKNDISKMTNAYASVLLEYYNIATVSVREAANSIDKYGYAFHDIDGNEIMELFCLFIDTDIQGSKIKIKKIYTRIDNKPKELIAPTDMQDLYLSLDDYIMITQATQLGGLKFYQLKSGEAALHELLYRWHEEEDEYYTIATDERRKYIDSECDELVNSYGFGDGFLNFNNMLDFISINEITNIAAKQVTYSLTAADPISSTVLVNGQHVEFDAYNINSNNYFKLRDIAYVMYGTEKQFSVVWDSASNSISLVSGQPYITVGGEMASKGYGEKAATYTDSKIFKDGVVVQFVSYQIEGNNYLKLRDLGEAFDFGIDWDETQNLITIDTSKGYLPDTDSTLENDSFISISKEIGRIDFDVEVLIEDSGWVLVRVVSKNKDDLGNIAFVILKRENNILVVKEGPGTNWPEWDNNIPYSMYEMIHNP